jgi:hypothetical protein
MLGLSDVDMTQTAAHLMDVLSMVLNIVYETRDRFGPQGTQCRLTHTAQRNRQPAQARHAS